MLINPNFSEAESHAKEAQEAARSLGVQIHVVRARTVDEFDAAFSIFVQQKVGVARAFGELRTLPCSKHSRSLREHGDGL
jgi:hypothetical protein